MAEIPEKSYWIINEAGLPVLARTASARLDGTFSSIDATLEFPLRLYAAQTPDTKLYIKSQLTVMGDGGGKSTGPLGSVVTSFVDSTIDFQSQLTTGGTISISFPASIVGRFRRCAFSLDNTGTLIASFSAESLSVAALANPGTLFVPDCFPVGWVDLECTHVSGKFKTATSLTDIIENSTGGIPRIVRIGSGGGGSGGGSNAGVAQEVAIADATDTFTVTFPTPLINTRYVPQVMIFNYTDPNPQFLVAVVTNKTITGFTVQLNAPTDSANYLASYIVPAAQEQVGEAVIADTATSVTVTLPIPLGGTNYSVVAMLVNYTDGSPQFQPVIGIQKTASDFTVKWNAPVDSGNYLLAYRVAQYV